MFLQSRIVEHNKVNKQNEKGKKNTKNAKFYHIKKGKIAEKQKARGGTKYTHFTLR